MNAARHKGLPGIGEAIVFRNPSAKLLLLPFICTALTGCFGFLKPAPSTAKYFVLTSVPAAAPGVPMSNSIAVGVGQVKIPAYLFNTSLAVRRGTNEIEYLVWAIWAERLDKGFQRVLVADLAGELHSNRVYLSIWNEEAVSAEVYITLERFEVTSSGEGILIARWRILAPGGDKILKAGQSRFTRSGPSPDAGAPGMVSTLSELVADFGRELAQTLRDSVATAP